MRGARDSRPRLSLLSETAYADALKREQDFDPKDFHSTLAYISRVQGAAKSERRRDALSERGGVESLGYHYSAGHTRRALRYAKSLDELFEDALLWGIVRSRAA